MVALHIEHVIHALGVGEGRRVDEDQVIFAPIRRQPGHHIGLHQLVQIGQPIEREIAPRPVQIGPGQIHAGGTPRAADRSVHGGTGGIAEQIEEALAAGLRGDAQAYRTVIQKQPGIQVIGQVDQQLHLPFLHRHELATLGHAFVLLLAGLALALLEHHPFGGDIQHLGQRHQHILQPCLGLVLADAGRRRILLHVGPAVIQIDGHGKLRHVRVIQPIAADVLLPRPFAQGLQVLLQAVGKHLRRLAESGLGSRCDRFTLLTPTR